MYNIPCIYLRYKTTDKPVPLFQHSRVWKTTIFSTVLYQILLVRIVTHVNYQFKHFKLFNPKKKKWKLKQMTIYLTLKLTVPKTCDSVPFSSCNKENVPVLSCNKRNIVECGRTPQQFLSQTLIGSESYSNCNFTFNFSMYVYTVNLCISKSCEPYFFYVCTIFTCTCIFF